MTQVYVEEAEKLCIKDAPVPKVSDPKGVLIKVLATGICTTDVHTFFGETIHGKQYPFHIGHEIAGKVEAVGNEVTKLNIGDRVVVNPLTYCMHCSECKTGHWNYCKNIKALGLTGPGGFSDYVYTVEQNTAKYKAKTANELSFSEPLATVLHAVNDLDQIGKIEGKSILIQGAGTIGLLFLKVFVQKIKEQKLCGQEVTVSDPDQKRHALILKNGGKAVRPENNDALFDTIIDCTGSTKAVQSALSKLKNHATLLLFGVCPQNKFINVDPFELYRREITIKGSFALNNNIQDAAHLIDSGKISVSDLIAGVIKREELLKTLRGLADKTLTGKYIVSLEGKI